MHLTIVWRNLQIANAYATNVGDKSSIMYLVILIDSCFQINNSMFAKQSRWHDKLIEWSPFSERTRLNVRIWKS